MSARTVRAIIPDVPDAFMQHSAPVRRLRIVRLFPPTHLPTYFDGCIGILNKIPFLQNRSFSRGTSHQWDKQEQRKHSHPKLLSREHAV